MLSGKGESEMNCTLDLISVAELLSPFDAEGDGCPVDWAKGSIRAFREKLCGKSLFCREGMAELHQIISDLSEGKAKPDDLPLLNELCEEIALFADCSCAKSIADNLARSLEEQKDIWEAHIRRKRCVALKCNQLLTFYIDAAQCTGCNGCALSCPAQAIDGLEGQFHIIRQESCIKCGRCAFTCPAVAICKAAAGAILPRLPEQPGAVGTQKTGLAGLKKGLRNRKEK